MQLVCIFPWKPLVMRENHYADDVFVIFTTSGAASVDNYCLSWIPSIVNIVYTAS